MACDEQKESAERQEETGATAPKPAGCCGGRPDPGTLMARCGDLFAALAGGAAREQDAR